jgi:hypothetical protein
MNVFNNVATLGSLLAVASFDAKAEIEFTAQVHRDRKATAVEMTR